MALLDTLNRPLSDVIQPASTGRSKCRGCGRAIAAKTLRFGEPFADGRFTASGTIHVECAEAYFGTAELRARLEHLPNLESSLVPELERALAHQRLTPKGDPSASGRSPERAGPE
jgi:hypothetical protein